MSNADDKWLETLRSKVESAPAELPEGGAEALCAGVARLQRRRRLARSFVALGSAAALALFLLLPEEQAQAPLLAEASVAVEPADFAAPGNDSENAPLSDEKPQGIETMAVLHSSFASSPISAEQSNTVPQTAPSSTAEEKSVDKPSETPAISLPDSGQKIAVNEAPVSSEDHSLDDETLSARRSFSGGLHLAFDGAANGSSTISQSVVSSASDHFGPIRTSSLFKGYHTEYEYFKPINLGLSLSIGLTSRLSLVTGLDYSFHRSKLHNYLNSTELGTDSQTLHFVGVPLGLRLTAFEASRSSVYGSVGVETYKCVYAAWNGNRLNVKPIVLSSHFSAGYQFALFNLLGLYVEPGISHYDDASDGNYTIYSQNPWQFELRAGLRLTM